MLFDENEFVSGVFQRPYQYLSQLDENKDLTDIDPEKPEGDKKKCLLTLLRLNLFVYWIVWQISLSLCNIKLIVEVGDYCLTPNEFFSGYIMVRSSYL